MGQNVFWKKWMSIWMSISGTESIQTPMHLFGDKQMSISPPPPLALLHYYHQNDNTNVKNIDKSITGLAIRKTA